MGRIRVLPEHVANQIAAGEVVERPASVVKELVENALDAGARRVAVTIERGGKELIRVEDDGSGLLAEDVKTAFERHATSKLETSDDLRRIGTLGFRGEALPSIASVARVRLETLAEGAREGTRIEIAGGSASPVEPIAFSRGTTIEVRDLFYNVPARLKFAKATGAETAACVAAVLSQALARPDVGFSLRTGTRPLVDAPLAKDLRDRVRQLFGHDLATRLLEGDAASGGTSLRLLLDLPGHTARTRGDLHVIVNGRTVVDRTLQHAVIAGYEGLLPGGRFPVAFVTLAIDPAEVDVNVHPAKTEVRFADGRRLHALVASTVRLTLARSGFIPRLEADPVAPGATPSLLDRVREAQETFLASAAADGQAAGEGDGGHGASRPYVISARSIGSDPNAGTAAGVIGSALFPTVATPAPGTPTAAGRPTRSAEACALGAPETRAPLAPAEILSGVPRVLGQMRRTFVVAEDRSGLLLVDQHTAHERVLYEKIRREGGARASAVQRLLVPEVIELAPTLAAALEDRLADLAAAGIEIEPMGSRSFAVRALPASTPGGGGARTARAFVERCLEAIADDDPTSGTAASTVARGAPDRVLATIACHAAIKVNMPLEAKKMEWLLEELFRCEDPYRCPHGRATVLRFDEESIKRAFGRTW